MNESCETYEWAISELVDGELGASEQLAAVDHLAACASCRAFYRRARRLGEMVARAEAAETPPPDEVWRRIAEETGAVRRRSPSVRVPRFALRLAAMIVLALGLVLVPRLWRTRPTPSEDGRIVVELGSDRGAMTEERFVEITTEILRSDARFHREMLAVMALVTSSSSSEGTVDRAVDLDEETDDREDDAAFAGERL